MTVARMIHRPTQTNRNEKQFPHKPIEWNTNWWWIKKTKWRARSLSLSRTHTWMYLQHRRLILKWIRMIECKMLQIYCVMYNTHSVWQYDTYTFKYATSSAAYGNTMFRKESSDIDTHMYRMSERASKWESKGRCNSFFLGAGRCCYKTEQSKWLQMCVCVCLLTPPFVQCALASGLG